MITASPGLIRPGEGLISVNVASIMNSAGISDLRGVEPRTLKVWRGPRALAGNRSTICNIQYRLRKDLQP